MPDGENNRTPNLPANGASVPATIMRLEQQLLKIWQGNSVHANEMVKKEALLIKEKVMFLDCTINHMTSIILKQAGTIQELRLANEKLQKSESSSALELECQFSQRLQSSSLPSPPPPSSHRKVEMADMSNQADMVNVKVEMFNHSSVKLVDIFNDWKSDGDSDFEGESGPTNSGMPFQLEGNIRPEEVVSCITSTGVDRNSDIPTVSYTATVPKLEEENVMTAAAKSADNTRYTTTHPTNVKLPQVPTNNKAKKEGQAWISHMVGVTDKLRKKYSIPVDKRRELQYKKGKRPNIVPRYMASIWKFYLAPPLRPIYVPDPHPVVNWANLNPNAARNLPKPVLCPVKGVSQDQAMYETKQKLDCFTNRTEIVESPFASKTAPFGTLRGLQTNLGVVAMPEVAIQGFVWSELYGDWVIAAIGD